MMVTVMESECANSTGGRPTADICIGYKSMEFEDADQDGQRSGLGTRDPWAVMWLCCIHSTVAAWQHERGMLPASPEVSEH
jgi:hypothetical protein